MFMAILTIILVFAFLPTVMLAVARLIKWMIRRSQKAVDTFKSIADKEER